MTESAVKLKICRISFFQTFNNAYNQKVIFSRWRVEQNVKKKTLDFKHCTRSCITVLFDGKSPENNCLAPNLPKYFLRTQTWQLFLCHEQDSTIGQ